MILALAVGCGPSAAAPDAVPDRGVADAAAGATPTPPARGVDRPAPAATAGTPTSQTTTFVPTILTLPSGDANAVDPAGVGADGVLQVPEDGSRVGWWTGGALAGEPFGSIVLAGHVDSRDYGLGTMLELLDVNVGDRVELGDGVHRQGYQISAITQVPKSRLAADTEAFRQDVDNRLVLITCVGPYDREAGGYPDNLVVIADEVG